ncbi:MAG: hypothetical protein HC927_08170 [Deltaproteobacteria bacterium]|nr:hypothetical protein [Deltaproteobacteria bacterium]
MHGLPPQPAARVAKVPMREGPAVDVAGQRAGALGAEAADHMIENVIGCLALPMGVATNFRINGRDYLVPMCVEEASVVAAASNAAKMIRSGGGFAGYADPPWMIAQIQLVRSGSRKPDEITSAISSHRQALLAAGR